MDLYSFLPDGYDKMPTLEHFKVDKYMNYTDCAFLVIPGGGYTHFGDHEGYGYAKMFNSWGAEAFVLKYSLHPTHFPAQLNDARRAVQYIRKHAEEYGINPNKIVVVGSSAGGHLAAMLSTYKEEVPHVIDELSEVDFLPNYQVLCYPVIDLADDVITHKGSADALLGENHDIELAKALSPNLIADESAPPAFIFHNADDAGVSVYNSINYAKKLISCKVPTELHVFTKGGHGVGIAGNKNCGQWTTLLLNWLKDMKIF